MSQPAPARAANAALQCAQLVKYVALLRGINVGGDNIIKMTELKGCFESLGLADVATYIQSENVLFSAAEQPPAELASQIEAALSERFGYDSRIVLRSHTQLRAIIDEAPAGFGSQPDLYRYDVVFLRECSSHLRPGEWDAR